MAESTSSPIDPLQTTLSDLQSELSTLNRVSHRLAMTDAGPALEKVLSLLLPRLLSRIGKNDDAKKLNRNNKRKAPSSTASSPPTSTSASCAITTLHDQINAMHETIHKKLIEMLTHTMKRVREDRTCRLPCGAILELLQPKPQSQSSQTNSEGKHPSQQAKQQNQIAITANSFTINLSLAFLTLGVNRCTPAECADLLPGLLTFLACILTEGRPAKNEGGDSTTALLFFDKCVGVSHVIDPSCKMRHDQTWHLVLRCLEYISHNPSEHAAMRRVAKSSPSNVSDATSDITTSTKTGDAAKPSLPSLKEAKRVIHSNPIIGAALFDLLSDVILYTPVPATSTLIPNGMSTSGYQRLVNGAASGKKVGSNCKNWKEEFAPRASLRELKLKMLDLIAPCRRLALFLKDNDDGNSGGGESTSQAEEVGDNADNVQKTTDGVAESRNQPDGAVECASDPTSKEAALGISRTVALMVLLTGDADQDVKAKAESYLRAHMDTYRGKDADKAGFEESSRHDALLGNSAALAQSILSFVVGGVASMSVTNRLMAQYKSEVAVDAVQSGLGLTYCIDKSVEAQQKALLSCSRMKVADFTSAPALKFVASKILEENPRLFHVMDMGLDEADVAAVFIGSMTLVAFGDLRQPGSSGSVAVESVASLLNALCLRLTLFYDTRVQQSGVEASLERIRLILAKSMVQASAVLSPMSIGQGASSSMGTNIKTANTQLNIRDQCYGVISTLARSRFSLDGQYAIFDCGNSNARSGRGVPLSTASMLFGCASNEVEMLRPRATSALDALLAAFVRVVQYLSDDKKILEKKDSTISTHSSNPWADIASNDTPILTEKETQRSNETEGLSRSLLPLLWTSSRRSQPKSSRLAAARWSNELMIKLDPLSAIHLLCFISGDDDATISMIAKKALGVDLVMGEDVASTSNATGWSDAGGSDAGAADVSFSDLVETVIGAAGTAIRGRPTFMDFPVQAQAVTLRFMLKILFSEESLYVQDSSTFALNDFVHAILRTLSNYKSRSLTRDETDLLDECSICLEGCVSTSRETRVLLTSSEVCFGFSDIAAAAIASNSSKARRHFSQIMGCLYEDHSIWFGSGDDSIWLEKCGLSTTSEMCREKLEKAFESSFVVGEVHGAAFLGSACVRAFRLATSNMPSAEDSSIVAQCWNQCSAIVSLLGKGLSHKEEVVGNACARGLEISFSYNGYDAPILNPSLYEGFALALNEMNSALKKFNSIDHADPTRVSTLIRAAGLLLAASTSGAGSRSIGNVASVDLGPARLQCTEALFSILGGAAFRKDDELSLAVGEALVNYADAFGDAKWSNDADGEWTDSDGYDETIAFELPPHQHILYTLFRRESISTNPLKRNSSAAALLAIVGHSSRIANMGMKNRAIVKETSKNLSLFQGTFIKLLSDPKSKQLSRESCCKGLAACRGLAGALGADEDILNSRLLKAFGQTSYGGSAMIETDSQARERRNEQDGGNDDFQETEVGGAAGMSESSLGAYREMSAAALALGRPDVVYTLMILSCNAATWISPDARDKYNEKALLGNAGANSLAEVRTALRPFLGKLIPRLLRACNDPNKQTREQMSSLWVALTGGGAESRAVITENFLTTVDVLIQDAVSSSWRARAGACSAISDIIVGRSWDDLGGGGVELDDDSSSSILTASIRLIRLWRTAMRALDDIRFAVREKGEALGRALRALTMRLCDPTTAIFSQDDEYISNDQRLKQDRVKEVQAEYAATVSLGWLVKSGLNAPCAEASGICISTLLGIVDVAKPSTIQPVLADLCYALLMAMSSLEPAALNYLQVRAAGDSSVGGDGADRYDRLERIRIQAASSGPIAGALNKCLEMVKHVDLESQRKLVPIFDSSLRQGAGFATRAATADAVTSLCSSCPSAFKFKGTSTSNPTVRLLRALYFASEKERGATAKDKMTHALGNLAELAPGSAVRQLAAKACERYCESSGINNDASTRKAAAATVRAIAVRSSNQFHDGGPTDIWRKKVLPQAFLGRHDEDAKVSSLWKEVWEEGGSVLISSKRGEDVFGITLQENILPFLVTSIVAALRDMSWARRRSACSALMELTEANILAPTPRTLSELEDDMDFERFRRRAKASSELLRECVLMIARSRLWIGKGDVIKASSHIAGKWCGVAPINGRSHGSFSQDAHEWIPLVLTVAGQQDLFKGDGYFSATDDDVGANSSDDCGMSEKEVRQIDSNVDQIDAPLDLSGENELKEESDDAGDSERDLDITVQSQPVIFCGFCKLLLEQGLKISSESNEGELPYKVAALSGLTALLRSVVAVKDSDLYDDVVAHQRYVYEHLAPQIFSFISDGRPGNGSNVPPLLIARSLECLSSSFYDGIGTQFSPRGLELDCSSDPLKLLKFFQQLYSHSAWTVRQMSVLATASMASKVATSVLQRNEVITTSLDCSTRALKDRKFWKVRQAGLELILALVCRGGKQRVSDTDSESRLVMESILPYKEKILDIARSSLSDSEAQVTATASKISLAMSWWP